MGKREIKVVIDSNVFVNALLGGKSKEIFKQIDEGDIVLILSNDIFEEYSALIEYPKIRERVDSLLFYSLLYEVYKKARFLKPNEQFNICRDREDNKFLDVVYASKADCLITLDRDLLDLRNKNKEFQIKEYKFKILRPEEFLKSTD
jgi:hypothetical protein